MSVKSVVEQMRGGKSMIDSILDDLSDVQREALYGTHSSPDHVGGAAVSTMRSLARLGLVEHAGSYRGGERTVHYWTITSLGIRVRRACMQSERAGSARRRDYDDVPAYRRRQGYNF
jgi:hypothetical protein